MDKSACHHRPVTPRVRGTNTAGGESVSTSTNPSDSTGTEPAANEVNINSNWVKVGARTVSLLLLTFVLLTDRQRNWWRNVVACTGGGAVRLGVTAPKFWKGAEPPRICSIVAVLRDAHKTSIQKYVNLNNRPDVFCKH